MTPDESPFAGPLNDLACLAADAVAGQFHSGELAGTSNPSPTATIVELRNGRRVRIVAEALVQWWISLATETQDVGVVVVWAYDQRGALGQLGEVPGLPDGHLASMVLPVPAAKLVPPEYVGRFIPPEEAVAALGAKRQSLAEMLLGETLEPTGQRWSDAQSWSDLERN